MRLMFIEKKASGGISLAFKKYSFLFVGCEELVLTVSSVTEIELATSSIVLLVVLFSITLEASPDIAILVSKITGSLWSTFNVYSFLLNNPGSVTKVTNHKTHPVRFLSLSKNGVLCYGYDGDIYVKSPGKNSRKISVSS